VRRLALRLALACALGLLLTELGLRLLLFSDWAPLARLGWSQRRAFLYADHQSEDLHWALRHRFGQVGPDRSPAEDELLGWRRGELIRPVTYEHRDARRLRGQQPVLMFGDSYTECTTPRRDCWEMLIEESALGETHAILNYGVSAYGLDQVTLLLERALAWVGSEPRPVAPIVVIGVMVDDDLDRTDLRLREWPKPHFRVVEGELVLEPPEALERSRWVAEFDGWPVSYLWRRVTRSRALPETVRRWFWTPDAHRERVAQRVPLLLDRIQAELEARGLEAFFLLFPGPLTLVQARETGWQERLLVRELEARGLRYENAALDFAAEFEATDRDPAEAFGTEGAGIDHYNRYGNEVALRALLRGLGG
jgi:hypothetical protein